MSKETNQLMHLVQYYFQQYLSVERGLSQNTLLAYRDALKLFFLHESKQQKKSPHQLILDDFNADSVLLFLQQIENTRNNSIVTRNVRLAALKTFSQFLLIRDIERSDEYQRIMALPLKKEPHKVIDYMEANEINTILAGINRNTNLGQRDYVLLNVLYNTGARVQELCDLTVSSITLGKLPMVTLTGKGNKTRQVPIWAETAELLSDYLQNNQLLDKPTSKLFMNSSGHPISRFGVRYIISKHVKTAEDSCSTLKQKKIGPHTFRHTIAMHLLQAGIDLSIIRSWLGHVSLMTTHAYIEIDMEMKRKVLTAYSPSDGYKSLQGFLDKNKDILTWLESI